MSTYVPSPSAPKAPREQRIQFKGRNGVSCLSEARVITLTTTTPELMVELFSTRIGDAAPAWLCGPREDVLTFLRGLLTAAEMEVAKATAPTPPAHTIVPYQLCTIAWQDRTDPNAGGVVLAYATSDDGRYTLQVVQAPVSDEYAPVRAGDTLYLYPDEILSVDPPEKAAELAAAPATAPISPCGTV